MTYNIIKSRVLSKIYTGSKLTYISYGGKEMVFVEPLTCRLFFKTQPIKICYLKISCFFLIHLSHKNTLIFYFIYIYIYIFYSQEKIGRQRKNIEFIFLYMTFSFAYFQGLKAFRSNKYNAF